MPDRIANKEIEAAWQRKLHEIEGASPKDIFLIGVGVGIQIERDQATRNQLDMVLAKISEVSPKAARFV